MDRSNWDWQGLGRISQIHTLALARVVVLHRVLYPETHVNRQNIKAVVSGLDQWPVVEVRSRGTRCGTARAKPKGDR